MLKKEWCDKGVKKVRATGFTLIELLVVISIISLLSSIVLTSVNSARIKARDAQRALSIRSVKTAIELYYDANGRYPDNPDASLFLSFMGPAFAPYIASIPVDPQAQNIYYIANADTYMILVYREGTISGGWGHWCRTNTVGDYATNGWFGGADTCKF